MAPVPDSQLSVSFNDSASKELSTLPAGKSQPEELLWRKHSPRDLIDQLESAMLLPDAFSSLAAFREVLAQAGSGDLPLIFYRVSQLHEGSLKDAQMAALIERWGLIDPSGAVMTLRKQGASSYQQQIGRIHAIWSQTAPGLALQSAQSLSDPRMRNVAVEHILSQRANLDPEGALRLLAMLPPHHFDAGWAHGHIFSKWAMLDPQAAAENVGRIRSPQFRQEAIAKLAAAWAASDLASALQWAREIESAPERVRAVQRIFEVWIEQDPRAAAAEVDLAPPGQAREFTRRIARHLAQIDPDEALGWIEQTGSASIRNEAMSDVAMVLVRTDPFAALEVVERIDEENYRGNALSNLVSEWLRVDWNQAWDWIQTLPGDRSGHLFQAASFLAHQDVLAAAEVALTVDGTDRRRFADAVLQRFAQVDPSGAFAWAQQLHLDERSTENFLTQIAQRWTSIDRESAEHYVRTQSDPGITELFAAGLIQSWARDDPGKAVSWLQHIPEGDARVQASAILADHWIRHDPREAANWINQLPSGPGRDFAVGSMVEHLSQTHPLTAFLWADTLQNAELRSRRLPALAWRLSQENPAFLRDLMHQAGISSEARAILQRALISAGEK